MEKAISIIKECSQQLKDLGVNYLICATDYHPSNRTKITITSVSGDKNEVQNIRNDSIEAIESINFKKSLLDITETDC